MLGQLYSKIQLNLTFSLLQYLPDSCCRTIKTDCGKNLSNLNGNTTAIEKQFYTKVSAFTTGWERK